MISLWEKQSFLTSDIIIIGAGISGLSTAASIKESQPELSVTVLERGILPSGASTKNAGFACFGSVTELLNDIRILGQEGMKQLVERRWRGLEKTRNRLSDQAIDLQVNGGYELLKKDQKEAIEEIDNINELLYPLFKQEVYTLADHKIQSFGLGNTTHLIENKLEGQLDTGKLISSLWDYCSSLGIRLHTGCTVTGFNEINDHVEVVTDSATFTGRKIGICTNAFTNQLLGESLDVAPGRGIVMTIRPEKQLQLRGTYHYEEGYYYFRDYYGKLLFGGGRNLDVKGETTTEFGINQEIKEKLLSDVKEIILPDQSFEVEMEWTGIMAFGNTKAPIIQKASDRIFMGVRLGGMGVAIGSLVGEELANLIMEE